VILWMEFISELEQKYEQAGIDYNRTFKLFAIVRVLVQLVFRGYTSLTINAMQSYVDVHGFLRFCFP